jgi:hypothetical protein
MSVGSDTSTTFSRRRGRPGRGVVGVDEQDPPVGVGLLLGQRREGPGLGQRQRPEQLGSAGLRDVVDVHPPRVGEVEPVPDEPCPGRADVLGEAAEELDVVGGV